MKYRSEMFSNVRCALGIIALTTLFGVAMVGPSLALSFYDGEAGSVNSLQVFGRSARFMCEWTDGKTAIMRDMKGRQRLISLRLPNRIYRVEVGHVYSVLPAPMYWIQGPATLKEVS